MSMIVKPRCLICGEVTDLLYLNAQKAGWLDRPAYHSPLHDMRIVLCPEHNTPENFEKARKIKRERIKREEYEDLYPDWWFEDDQENKDSGLSIS